MFNNESQSEENQSHMNNLFSFPFINDEYNILEDDIIISSKLVTIPLKTINGNRNEDSEDSLYGNAKTGYKSNFFKIAKKNNKIGRKRKNETEIIVDTGHNKYQTDNILRKLQVHFISFIIKFINLVVLVLGYRDEFCNINYSFKTNVNKSNIEKLKISNIGYILNQNISTKYQKDAESNKVIYEKLKNNPILCNIFSYNYKDFFKDFYYNKESSLNLNKFGLNINLKHKYGKEIKMYNDLKEENNKDPLYTKRLEECVNNLLEDEKWKCL